MAESLLPEAAKRSPFANYDIVVYFGAGLFLIPFLNRYLFQPLKLSWPNFKTDMGSEIANEAVSILSLLFFIYISGHILAYIASQIVEKTVDRAFGKVSSAIILSSQSTPTTRNTVVRALIYNRLVNVKKDGALLSTTVRFLFHLPVLPVYGVMFVLGVFGYYDTRLKPGVLDAVRAKIGQIGAGPIDVTLKSKWYKVLEYYVINRRADAVPRMYNYLVISGLFRSVCLIFLFSIWMTFYYLLHFDLDGDWFLKPLIGSSAQRMGLIELIALMLAYTFCLFSYIKFQRRYAEEAIYAFVFGQD